jgi:hypothetical protein
VPIGQLRMTSHSQSVTPILLALNPIVTIDRPKGSTVRPSGGVQATPPGIESATCHIHLGIASMRPRKPGLDRAWPARKPDFWAGDKGGRPLGKRPPLPKRGDTLPREQKHSLKQTFRDHALAVAYAKTFQNHAQITPQYREIHGEMCKVFFVDPTKGKREMLRFGGVAVPTGKHHKNTL